jgi:hypothetical protein
VSSVDGGLWEFFEEVIASSHELFNLARRELSGFRKKPHGPRGINGQLANSGRVEMHAPKFVAADYDDGVLSKTEEQDLPDQEELKGADNIASGRELKLRVAAFRLLTSICVTTPLNKIAIAVSHGDEPKAVIDLARILLVVNPYVQSC